MYTFRNYNCQNVESNHPDKKTEPSSPSPFDFVQIELPTVRFYLFILISFSHPLAGLPSLTRSTPPFAVSSSSSSFVWTWNWSQVTLFSFPLFVFVSVSLSWGLFVILKNAFCSFFKIQLWTAAVLCKNQTTPLRHQPFLDLISILHRLQLPLRLITSSSVPAAQSWHPTYRNKESFLCFSVSPNYGWNFNTNLFASVLSTAGCPPPKSWVFWNFFKLIFESFPS